MHVSDEEYRRTDDQIIEEGSERSVCPSIHVLCCSSGLNKKIKRAIQRMPRFS